MAAPGEDVVDSLLPLAPSSPVETVSPADFGVVVAPGVGALGVTVPGLVAHCAGLEPAGTNGGAGVAFNPMGNFCAIDCLRGFVSSVLSTPSVISGTGCSGRGTSKSFTQPSSTFLLPGKAFALGKLFVKGTPCKPIMQDAARAQQRMMVLRGFAVLDKVHLDPDLDIR